MNIYIHTYIHIYIYIYIYIYWKKIYIGKKEKPNLVIPIEKNQKTRNWLVKRSRAK